MILRRYLAPAVISLALLPGSQQGLTAQVVEARESEANPAPVLLRATLYGAGTGLVLGGAYLLVKDDDGPDTGEVLRWSTAGGAAAGFLIGLIYVATRPQPEGSIGEEGLVQLEGSDVSVSPIGLLDTRIGALGPEPGAFDLNLAAVRF